MTEKVFRKKMLKNKPRAEVIPRKKLIHKTKESFIKAEGYLLNMDDWWGEKDPLSAAFRWGYSLTK